MIIPHKSLNSGFSMPVLGLGTWRMGGDLQRNPHNDDARDIAAIRRALESGITHIDTAEMYAEGRAEELVAEALSGWDRSGLLIASKVRPENLRYQSVKDAARRSLERLRLDYLDLYYVHAINPAVPLAETMRALNELAEEGLVRHIGVSNFSPASVAAAQRCSSRAIVCNQVHYNLRFREPERQRLIEHCKTNDMFLVAWRPLQYGEGASTQMPGVLKEMCEKYGATPSHIWLSWLLSQDRVTALVKTTDPAHLNENLAALTIRLEAADIERLRLEFPGQEDVSRVPMQ